MKRAILIAAILSGVLIPTSWSDLSLLMAASPDRLRAIRLEVQILETNGTDDDEQHLAKLSGTADEVTRNIEELKAAGWIIGLERIQMTMLEKQETQIQTVVDVPVPRSRTFGRSGGPARTSFEQRTFGTSISAEAEVAEKMILLRLDVEKSKQLNQTDDAADDEEAPISDLARFLARVTMRIGDGMTVVAGGSEQQTEAGTTGQLLLASVHVLDEPPEQLKRQSTQVGAERDARMVRIYTLRRASSEDAAAAIERILSRDSSELRVTADIRSNSLVVSTDKPEDLDTIESILAKLEEGDARRLPPPKEDAQAADVRPAPPQNKYRSMSKRELQEALTRLLSESTAASEELRVQQQELADATKAYRNASAEEKRDALFRMLEADAASRAPAEAYRQLRADLKQAQQAYVRLLVGE